MVTEIEVDRKSYLGSHDIAAVMGDHPFMKRMDVFMNKTGESKFVQTEQQEWGLLNEQAILFKYGEKTELHTTYFNHFQRHKDHEWMGGHSDAVFFKERRGVDAKNIRFKGHEWGEAGTDQVPRYVLWQAHHFMTLYDFDVWDICVLFSGCQHEIYTVQRDQSISDSILEIGQEFWENHIVKGIAPEIDDSEACRLYLRKKYPSHDDELRVATVSECLLMAELRDAEAVKKINEATVIGLKNHLQDMIGGSKGLVSPFGNVTWKHQAGARRIDTKKLKAEHPEIAKQCTKQGDGGRVFRKSFKEE